MSPKTPPSQARSHEPATDSPKRPNSYHGMYSPVRQGRVTRSQSMKGVRPTQNWRKFLPTSPRQSPRHSNSTRRAEVDAPRDGTIYFDRPGDITTHDLPPAFESDSSALSSKCSVFSDPMQGTDLAPETMSPLTRENTFSGMMTQAFDLTNSPLGLGRRLSTGARPCEAWRLQSPTTPPSSYGESSLSCTSPVRSGKRVASSEAGSAFKLPKTDSDSSPTSSTGPKGHYAFNNNPWDIPITTRDGSNNIVLDAHGASRLLKIMKSNIRQSQELADLFARFVQQSTTDPTHQASRSYSRNSRMTKPLNYTETADSGSHSSGVGNGGDGPDPPREPGNPFRGHMIERQDIGATDTESENDQNLDCFRDISPVPEYGELAPLGDNSISVVRQAVDPTLSFSVPYLPDNMRLSLNVDDFSHGIVFPTDSPGGWDVEILDYPTENGIGTGGFGSAEGRSCQNSLPSELDRGSRSKGPSPESEEPTVSHVEDIHPEVYAGDCSQPVPSRKKSVRFDPFPTEIPSGVLSGGERTPLEPSTGGEPEAPKVLPQTAKMGVQFDLPLRGNPTSRQSNRANASENKAPSPKPRKLEPLVRHQLCAALETDVADPPSIRPPSPVTRFIPSTSSPVGPRAPPSSPLRQ
ncbi:hypothetical protein FQN54_005739 [Arachnomyces sp. PD_36]|nr:hypothetical protein FQN54_005739 [Arachnomyces sp. PD_36]